MTSPSRLALLARTFSASLLRIEALAMPITIVLWAAAALAGVAASQQVPVRPGAGAKTQRGSTAQPGSSNALDTAHMPDPDSAAESSPVAAAGLGRSLRLDTIVSVVVTQAVSSGSAHNGDPVRGQLAAPVRTTSGATLPAGTRVEATVVSAAAAGVIASGGVLSLQLTRVGAIPIISDVRDFNGQEGTKDVADSAPRKGTEAMVPSGAALQFRIMQQGPATGLVPGVPPAAQPAGVDTAAGRPGGSRAPGPGRVPNPPSSPAIPPPPHR